MKNWESFIFVPLLLFITINLHSQHPNCNSIELEDLICDFELLDGFTGTLNTEISDGVQPSPLCEGLGVADNIIWFGFIAPAGDFDIVLSFENCESGAPQYEVGPGVQLGVYTDCTFTESIFCTSEIEDTLSKAIPSSILQPGHDYFLFIDGFAGGVCDYAININGTYESNIELSGITFVDYNADGIQNEFEPQLGNVVISLEPGALMRVSDNEGYFAFEDIPDGTYTLMATVSEGEWIEEEIVIEVSVQDMCNHLTIGFVPKPNLMPDALVSITNSFAQCGLESNFYISIENTSSSFLSGTFEFEFDDLTSYISSDIIDFSIMGNILVGKIGILAPFEVKDYLIRLQMPPNSDPLPELEFSVTVFDDSEASIAEYSYSDSLRCSSHPIDKKTHPDRPGEENLTLIEEDLEYKIRFQNNGPDTAFNVKIIDQLDSNIILSSVSIVNSSHPVETTIESSTIEFLFEDIQLVDSTTNFDDSQGFVTFRCNVIESIAENTEVFNQAEIIFDMNMPIVTNTTLNTFVSQLCTSDTTQISVNICDGENYFGYDSTGIFTSVEQVNFGCDSTTIINLTVTEPTTTFLTLEACEGDTILISGIEYILSESTEIIDTTFDSNDCISNFTVIDLMINPIQMIDIDTTICEGMNFLGFTESGEYSLDSINAAGCTDIYTIQLTVLPLSDPSCTVGTAELPTNEVIIYPNPARDQFFIEGEAGIDAISMYTMDYQKIKEVVISNRDRTIEVSTQNLYSGLYIIEIKSEDRIFYKKLIVK